MSGSKVHKTWIGIRKRCDDPKTTKYHLYGGRGIRVCERWQTFENFYADMGDPPSDRHTIDRINSDGNYEPENCRWATYTEQNRNRTGVGKYLYKGEMLTLVEISERNGVAANTMAQRLARGFCEAEAFESGSRRDRLITRNGETHSVTEWADILGVSRNALYKRLQRKGTI